MIAVRKFIAFSVYNPTKVGKIMRISIKCRKFGAGTLPAGGAKPSGRACRAQAKSRCQWRIK